MSIEASAMSGESMLKGRCQEMALPILVEAGDGQGREGKGEGTCMSSLLAGRSGK